MINYFRRKQLKNRLQAVFYDRPTTRKSILLFLVLMITGFVLGLGLVMVFSHTLPTYNATLTQGEKQVYDGDTLKDVRIQIFHYADKIPKEPVEIFPQIWLTPSGIELETDIRIAGIDTPEKRPSTKNADGTKRSEESRKREKAAALAAQQSLNELLAKSKYVFDVINPKLGKYAGRTVANVVSGETDVATYLIDQGHAKIYDGGTKPLWDFGD